ncbi:MAG: hypothetical protein AB7R89_04995 [Dehalococcoidia bacterium]
MNTIDQLIERLANDEQFRAQILEDTDAALAEYDLPSGDRDRLLQQAEMIEAGVQVNPLQPTDADDRRRA